MALRASISLTNLQASTTAARVTAQTTYQLGAATGIWTDPDSKNRVILDEYLLSEVHFTLLEKNVSDSYTFSDSEQKHVGKGFTTDSVSFTETFVNQIAYHRKFNDAFTLDDLSQIDKDFYGNKGNIFAFTDILGLTYEKNLTDNYTVGDFVAAAVNKVAQDSFSFTDTSYSTFSKVVNDAFTLDDSALIDKDFYGNRGNVLGVADIFVRAVDYKRRFPGNLPLGSNLLNSNSLDASSTPDTRVIVEDKATVLSKKSFNETLGFIDSEYFSYSKNSSDTVFFAETDYKNIEKALPDSFSFSDIQGVQLVKTISDSFALDDAALVNKNYIGNKGNIMSLSDLVEVNLIRSNQLGTRSLNTMPFN